MPPASLIIAANHDYRLVALSVFISILGAYAARALIQRMRESRGWIWFAWLVGGATVDGIGTWSMHYTGKLALVLPIPLLLDWPTVLLSLFVGIIGSGGALALLSRRPLGWPRAVLASIVLGGVAVSGLHFTAMSAIRQPDVYHHYLPFLVVPILLAIIFSLLAIAVAFLFGGDTPAHRVNYHGGTWLRALANPVMHYTAMAGVIFAYATEAPDLSHVVNISSLGLLGISIVPVMLLVVLLLTSLVDRLRRQNDILQKVFQHIPVMLASVDERGGLELVNPEWERTTGWSLEEIRSQNLDMFAECFPDARLRREFREFVTAGKGEWKDFNVRVKNGRFIDMSAAFVRLSDGTSLGIGQDITGRQRTEESLRESEERFRQFAENLQDVIWMVDSKVEQLLYINPAYEAVWGLSREAIYQNMHAFMDPVHPEDREIVIEMLREQKEAKLITAEYRIIRPDGAVRWIRDRSFPVRNNEGEIYRIAGVAEDITEKKQAEYRLREYEKVVEGLEEMIVVVDRNYRYVLVNREFLKYRGVASEELIGRLATEFLSPEVFDTNVKWRLDEAFSGKVVKYELKYRYVELGERDLFISYFPIEGPEGIDGVACVLQDITERKRAEEQIRATSEQLRALSASLQFAREEEGTRIARELHDELGGALTSLKWDLEAADETLSGEGDRSQLQELRKKIVAMVKLTDTTINTVRRISSELRPPALDTLGLIEAIQWQAIQFQTRTGTVVECDCNLENLDLSREESTTVFRIFQEALTNILRHAQATTVHIQTKVEDSEFVLVIRDNGRGITDEQKSGRRTLGLLGMRERAHLIGANIDIAGVSGEGTVVTVRISIAQRTNE
jgi:PAS domain S-box-containing protein